MDKVCPFARTRPYYDCEYPQALVRRGGERHCRTRHAPHVMEVSLDKRIVNEVFECPDEALRKKVSEVLGGSAKGIRDQKAMGKALVKALFDLGYEDSWEAIAHMLVKDIDSFALGGVSGEFFGQLEKGNEIFYGPWFQIMLDFMRAIEEKLGTRGIVYVDKAYYLILGKLKIYWGMDLQDASRWKLLVQGFQDWGKYAPSETWLEILVATINEGYQHTWGTEYLEGLVILYEVGNVIKEERLKEIVLGHCWDLVERILGRAIYGIGNDRTRLEQAIYQCTRELTFRLDSLWCAYKAQHQEGVQVQITWWEYAMSVLIEVVRMNGGYFCLGW